MRPAVFGRGDALALALALAASQPVDAAAHCYSVWRYPFAQRCFVPRRIVERTTPAPVPQPSQAVAKPGPAFDIPLSDPDPLTIALRAKLWSGGLK